MVQAIHNSLNGCEEPSRAIVRRCGKSIVTKMVVVNYSKWGRDGMSTP